ncbi:MAG TPA: NAD(P)-binding protein [Thermoanaerobaculia bacterium]|nr:NAD(P)-binding protein [Thermoanaerobaculia bacterium]
MEEVRLTRRDAIVALMGTGAAAALAAALASCGRRSDRALPFEGGFAVPDEALGHRLRRGDLLARPAVRTERVGTAILGGGISGLAAAWALERAGDADFRVYELESAPGGTALSGASDVSRYPWGARYAPVPVDPSPAREAVLSEVGALVGRDANGDPVFAEEMLCREPEERLFFGYEWHPGLYPRVGASGNDLAQLAGFEAEMAAFAALRDGKGRRAFAVPTSASSDDAELLALDQMTMGEWMRSKGFDSPRLLWLAEYGCRDDFAGSLDETSAWAGLHYYAARLRGEGPGEEPAPFLTWPEGNGRLVHHLATSAAGRLVPSALVFDVVPRRSPAAPVAVRYLDAAKDEVVAVEARDVVLALPKFVAARVLAPWRENPPPFLRTMGYAPWIVANLTLSARPRERATSLAWDNVIYDSRSLGYVVATHQAGRDHGPTVLTWYHAFAGEEPRAAREKLFGMTWEEIASAALADLTKAHPDLPRLVTRLDVARWGHAMLRPAPGFLSSPARRLPDEPLGGVRFAHADTGLPLFEDALDAGVRAAGSILRERSRRPPPFSGSGR